jgi:hypothetical protein
MHNFLCIVHIFLCIYVCLPAFAESPVRKGGDECEKGIRHSLGARPPSRHVGTAEDGKADLLRRVPQKM